MASLETALKRDRAVVLSSLVAVSAIAWLYLVHIALNMAAFPASMEAVMTDTKPWNAVDFLLMFVMWAVMMVGMMMPGAAPMILLFATVNRKIRESGSPYVSTSLFALGYVLAWTGFSMVATVLQWQLHALALLSPMMVSTSGILGGLLFVAAGIYQWTPLKHVCLKNCRSPLDFILNHWREGPSGTLRMGLEHGTYCVGCCWFLMGLLFIGGVMNLLWVAAIALFVLGEKVLPSGKWLTSISGGAMVLVGSYMLHQALAG